MIRNCNRLSLLCAALFSVSAVHAADWYFGIGAGVSTYDAFGDFSDTEQDVNELDDFPGIDASFDVDDSDTAVKLFAGFPLTSSFGVEFAYVDLGETSVNFTLESDGTFFSPGSTEVSGSASIDGLSAGLIGNLPLSDTVSLNGRAGVYLWDAEGDFSAQDTTGIFDDFSDSVSDDGNDVYYGIGLDIGWFGLFYEIYDIDGDDVDLLGVSAKFN